MIASAEKIFNSVAIPASGEITPDKDTSIIITSNNSTLTLNSGAFAGIEVSLTVLANASITYDGVNGVSCTNVVSANKKMTYIYTGSAWFCSSCPVAIGDVYTQYPDTLAPGLLYGGQWEEHDYGGLFFRSEGGNAHAFVPEITGSFTSAKVFVANEAFSNVVAGDLAVIDGQYNTVASVSGTTINMTNDVSNWSIKTKVLIGQDQSAPNINGAFYQEIGIYGAAANNAFVLRTATEAWIPQTSSSIKSATRGFNFDASRSNSIYGRGDGHVKPINLSLKNWKRIS